MAKTILLVPALSAALMISGGYTLAADQQTTQQDMQTQQQVYGKELMTSQERDEHHARMQAAKSQQERDQIRKQQHERMKQRASERGVSIPDQPPPRAKGSRQYKAHNGGGQGH